MLPAGVVALSPTEWPALARIQKLSVSAPVVLPNKPPGAAAVTVPAA